MTTPTPTSPPCVTELTGDLFALAPDNAVLVHACNTRGQWGAGIAKRFKELYPAAYKIYNMHCKTNSPATGNELLGTTLLIPPQEGDFGFGNEDGKGDGKSDGKEIGKRNWIACLFTSKDYGKRKGSPEGILEATRGALEDLKTQLKSLKAGKDGPGEVWGCRFNSKSFGVEWERSRKVVEEVGVGMVVVEFE